MMIKRQEIFLVAAILLVAAFLRLYRLDQVPPGLHYDEAFNATQAQKVLAGVEQPLVFSEDLAEEPMAIYTASAFFALFGTSPFSLRLVSAVVGILTIATLYFLARQLFSSRFAALLSAFILAILYWHVNFSRLGMEPIFLPLILSLALVFFIRARLYVTRALAGSARVASEVKQPPNFLAKPVSSLSPQSPSKVTDGIGFAFAGLFLALTLYTYKSALFVPILFAAFIFTEILIDRSYLARNSRGLALLILVAVLVFSPLGLYWATHPSEFVERPSSVLVSPSVLANNVVQVCAMFFLHGDENPRSNLPGRPILDPVLAIGFIVGITVSLARWRRVEARLMLLWLGVMVLPSVFTDFAPHFGRSIGAAPAVALVTGYGFTALVDKIPSRHFAFGLLFLGLAFSTLSTFRDYFDVWASRTGQFDSFDVGLLSLAQKLRLEPASETIFLSPVDANHYTIQFGLNGTKARSFDGRRVLALPEPGAAVAYGIITRDDTRSFSRLRKIFPSGRVIDTIYDLTATPYAVIFRAEGSPQVAPQKRIDARLGDTISLIGYDIARNGNEIALTLYWGSIAETSEDYTVFAHLLSDKSQVIVQDDDKPGHGTFSTPRWSAGQVILDDYRLVIPPNTPPGEYQIEIGMYVLATGTRVHVTDANSIRLENDRVLVERFTYP